MPDRYSSPATPTGTGRSRLSRINERMPRIGPPMVTSSPGTSASLMLVMMVVSVGPYPLWKARIRPVSPSGTAHFATSSGGQASPPATSTRRVSRPVGSKVASAAGVMKACVTRSRRISSDSSSPP
ncbi:Uncharacterised protein [Mycobacteroides abscessus subsp. abscessus]|nr:Uncharacterised protein [Mycobacteroides abscessus subsp. abscessus]